MKKVVMIILLGCFITLVLSSHGWSHASEMEEAKRLDEEVERLFKDNRFEEAHHLSLRVLAIREKVLGPKHPDTAHTLQMLAQICSRMGDNNRAISFYKRSLEIREKILGLEDLNTAVMLNNLADLYISNWDLDRAFPLLNRSLKIMEKIHGPNHLYTAIVILTMAELYHKRGDYKKALPLYQRSLEILKRDQGQDHPNTIAIIGKLGNLYKLMGEYDKALPLLQQLLAKSEKLSGCEHLDITEDLNLLADIYRTMGVYEKALPLFQRSLKIRESVLGKEHPLTATILHNLGLLYWSMGYYDKSLLLLHQSLQIIEKVYGPENLKTATCLSHLASNYHTIGLYDKALTFYEKALKIKAKVLGEEHPDVSFVHNNLSTLYFSMGSFEKSLYHQQQALKTMEKVLGVESPEYAASLHNLATLYWFMGFSEQAIRLLEQSLKIMVKVFGPAHLETRSRIETLGFLYLSRKDYKRAKTYFQRANSRTGLIDLYLATGQSGSAINLLKTVSPASWRDTSMYQSQYHTQYGLALFGVGHLKNASEELVSAIKFVEEMRVRVIGKKMGFFKAGGIGGRIRPYRALVSTLSQRSLQAENQNIIMKIINKIWTFIKKVLVWIGIIGKDPFSAYGKDLASAAFYFSESTKARTLIEEIANSARKYESPEILDTVRKQEQTLQNQLAKLDETKEEAYKKGEEAFKEHQERYEKAKAETDALIAKLRKEHSRYAALMYPQPFRVDELPLKDNEVLLEYAITDKATYLFVVEKGKVKKLIKAPKGKEDLEELVNRFVFPLQNKDRKENFSPSLGRNLYNLFLKEALKDISPDKNIIIVPDGILGLLPFEALVIKAGKSYRDSFYVGDKYKITYSQSASVLALNRLLKDCQAKKPLFALGNPIYNESDERYIAYKRGKPQPILLAINKERSAFRALATRREWGKPTMDDKEGKQLVYPPLPETEDEVRAIAKDFGVKPIPPAILLGISANETNLRKSPLGDYRYIHFATHADLPGKVQGINEPFLLLGQVGNKGKDDGFLTMTEVLELDLDADMVVLSACLTGRGKVMEGEGVLNFARAFQHAGARSVVVSLWEVASDEAVEHMTAFYGYLKAGKGKAEALQLARNEIKAKYPNPFYWAVFILHGEG